MTASAHAGRPRRHADAAADTLLTPLRACASGKIAPNVALARMLIHARAREAVEDALATAQQQHMGASAAARVAAAAALWRETPGAWDAVKQVLEATEHGSMASSAREWAARFDAAVRASPEASAAVYSLGRQDLLDAAAQDIVRRLRSWGLTGRSRSALDLGCGSGRLSSALSPHMRRIVGADVSSGMLATARRRCRSFANVSLFQSSGQDLAGFADGTFNLVAAVDVFPYLASCGGDLAQRHICEAHRVLAPGGSLLILNYSYNEDAVADAAEAVSRARRAGFRLVRVGDGDFALWDGRTFHFRRPEA